MVQSGTYKNIHPDFCPQSSGDGKGAAVTVGGCCSDLGMGYFLQFSEKKSARFSNLHANDISRLQTVKLIKILNFILTLSLPQLDRPSLKPQSENSQPAGFLAAFSLFCLGF